MCEQEMAEYLDSEQFALLQSRVKEIKGNTVEVLRHLAVNQIAGYLEISPEQLVQLRPILHEHFVKISKVIRHASENPKRSKEMLVSAYEEVAAQLQTNLSSILTPAQMEQVRLWLDESLDKILVIAENYLEQWG